jgi:pimeloyl-[acyl-carrier protein] methyl ester esterase
MPSDAGLHHEDLGTGAPVVLVHGWAASSAVFAGEAEVLARTRRVLAPDLRGHGRSAPAPFGLADLAGDLVALFERLDLAGAALVGWSLGAQVALAALPRLRPRLAGLVLVSATPRFTMCDGWPHGLPAQAVEVLGHRVRRDPRRALDRFFESCFVPGELDVEGLRRLTALREHLVLPDPAAALAGLEVLLREDLRAALPAVDLPTRVLHGERDPICPAGAGHALAAAIPGARLDVVPGAGHAPFLSHPGLLVEAALSLPAP